MQRKPGTLTPLEVQILQTAQRLSAQGAGEFYGFFLAKRMKADYGSRFRTAHGPLYKALDRMDDQGLLESRWEEAGIAEAKRRPRRCFYRVTAEGIRALEPVAEIPLTAGGEAPA